MTCLGTRHSDTHRLDLHAWRQSPCLGEHAVDMKCLGSMPNVESGNRILPSQKGVHEPRLLDVMISKVEARRSIAVS